MFDLKPDSALFPDSSIVKIFPSAKPIPEEMHIPIQNELNAFLDDWKTHGKPLAAQSAIIYKHFLVVVIDDALQLPSGCSIDSLFKKIVELELKYQVSLNDRSFVYLFEPENQHITTHYFHSLPNLESSKDTWVVDLMCDRYHTLRDQFIKNLIGSPYEKLFA